MVSIADVTAACILARFDFAAQARAARRSGQSGEKARDNRLMC
jgi:hypothetical protein